MSSRAEITATLARLRKLAPMGYFIGLHIRYAAPIMQFQAYPKAWTDHYAERGYALRDPTIAWGFANNGAARWSALAHLDTAGIFADAAAHGLKHGLVIGTGEIKARTLETDLSVPVAAGPWWYYTRTREGQQYVFGEGRGWYDGRSGRASVAWDGGVRIRHYAIMAPGVITSFGNPRLDVEADGSARLSVELSWMLNDENSGGYHRVTMATFDHVELSREGQRVTVTGTPDFAGREYREGDRVFSGSFPGEFIDALHPDMRPRWYASGSGGDAKKTPLPLSVSFDAEQKAAEQARKDREKARKQGAKKRAEVRKDVRKAADEVRQRVLDARADA